jgi:hypothetical protein
MRLLTLKALLSSLRLNIHTLAGLHQQTASSPLVVQSKFHLTTMLLQMIQTNWKLQSSSDQFQLPSKPTNQFFRVTREVLSPQTVARNLTTVFSLSAMVLTMVSSSSLSKTHGVNLGVKLAMLELEFRLVLAFVVSNLDPHHSQQPTEVNCFLSCKTSNQ